VTRIWSARRADYRVVYEIDEEARAIIGHRIQHRRAAYRAR
jgi:mRNA interferase RelE/StbE